MSGNGANYSGGTFKDWYMKNYQKPYDGSSPIEQTEGMSDKDFAVGKTLQRTYDLQGKLTNQYYQNIHDTANRYDGLTAGALSDYEAARKALAESKRQQEQTAGVAFEKMKKYMPQQIKAQGLDGLGVSESTMAEAYNNFIQRMGGIEADYGRELVSLEDAYGARRRGYEQQKGEALSALKKQYDMDMYQSDKDAYGNFLTDTVVKEFDSREEAEQLANFNAAWSAIGQSNYATLEDMKKFIDGYRPYISEAQYQALDRVGRGIVESNSRSAAYGTVKANIEKWLYEDESLYHDKAGNILTEKGRDKLISYLEENKDTLGEADYQAELSAINKMGVYDEKQRLGELEKSMKRIAKSQNYNTKLAELSEIYTSLDGIKGEMSDTALAAYRDKLLEGTETEYEDYNLTSESVVGWLQLTVGGKKLGNGETIPVQYGEKITSDGSVALLNELASGRGDTPPKVGKLIVVSGDMYCYTKKGWRKVAGNSEDMKKAVNAFLGKGDGLSKR